MLYMENLIIILKYNEDCPLFDKWIHNKKKSAN
jgi:hypothetical protein